jgi:hypothetical protein
MKNHPGMIDQISHSNSPQSLYCQTRLTRINPVGSRLMEKVGNKILPPSKYIFMNSLHILRYNAHEIIHGNIMMYIWQNPRCKVTWNSEFKRLENGVLIRTWALSFPYDFFRASHLPSRALQKLQNFKNYHLIGP